MSENHVRTRVESTKTSGFHNDFSEQEETMTNSAMPPAFALTASAAADNPGTGNGAKPRALHVEGVPEELVALLVRHEGVVYKSYPDNGHVSAGLGHLLKTKEEQERYPEGTAVPVEQVEAWARQDVGEAWRAAQAQAAMLGVDDHGFKVALASMSFQNGVYWYTEHKKTWALMKEHRWAEAATEAADSEWAVQTPARLLDFQTALHRLAGSSPAAKPARGWGSGHSAPSSPAKEPQSKAPATPTKGEEGVRQVQTRLKALGLYSGAIDGKELRGDGKESGTTKGIKEFQKGHGLPVTGKVDAATWAALSGGDSPSIWERFMAGLEQPREGGAKMGKGGGLADPFRKLAAEARKKAALEECGEQVEAGSGDFMGDQYWRSQVKGGEQEAVNFGMKNCRLVSTEMLLLYLQGEQPETLASLGLPNTGDLRKDVGAMQVVASESEANFLRVLEEDKLHNEETQEIANYNPDEWYLQSEQAPMAIAYIESYLKRKIPVLVGVDHTFNRNLSTKTSSKSGNGYNEGTTDHFVTLSGMGSDESGKFYTYCDPGRSMKADGAGSSAHNRLYHQGGTAFKGAETGSRNKQTYHLTMVVLFPADREKFAKERRLNRKAWVN